MQSTQSRRRVLATLFSAATAGLIGGKVSAQEAPPEITTIRLGKIPGVCIAPQYVAEELLRAAIARSGHDQIDPHQDNRPGHRLAFLQRA